MRARAAQQREALAQHVWPVENALAGADHALRGVAWLKQHPGAVVAAVAAVLIVSPKRAWRWARRSFVVWRGWRTVKSKLAAWR